MDTVFVIRFFCFLGVVAMIVLLCLWGNGTIGKNHPKIKAPKLPEALDLSHIKLNHKPSPFDARDFEFQLLKTNLPPSVDLSGQCSSVKDQGMFGSCTAFSAVGNMEYIYKKYDSSIVKPEDIFSERFTYYTTREAMGVSPTEDSGAFLRDTFKTLVKKGSCLEASCPYYPRDNRTLSEKPSGAAYKEAMAYQVLSYARIPENENALVALKSALSEGYVVSAGFSCYDNFYSSVNGVIHVPAGNYVGGHAILIVGYDEEKQLLKFKNSWSPSWGDKGYGYLPYAFLTSGDLYDMWMVYSEEFQNVSIGIYKPDFQKDNKIASTTFIAEEQKEKPSSSKKKKKKNVKMI